MVKDNQTKLRQNLDICRRHFYLDNSDKIETGWYTDGIAGNRLSVWADWSVMQSIGIYSRRHGF